MEDACEAGPSASPCPCCTLLVEHELIHKLSQRKSEDSILKCKPCEAELRERANETKKSAFASGGAGAANKGHKAGKKTTSSAAIASAAGTNKGGGNKSHTTKAMAEVKELRLQAQNATSASFVCLTCTFACCEEHARDHFESNRKQKNKKLGGGGTNNRHTEHHCVFYSLDYSKPNEGNDFRCFCLNCDLLVGAEIPDDMDYDGQVDGHSVNAAGYAIDGVEDFVSDCARVVASALERVMSGDAAAMKRSMRKLARAGGGKEKSRDRQDRHKRKWWQGGGGDGEEGGGRNSRERTKNPEIKEQGIVGLTNMGNTCFFNSTLQCLLQTNSLRSYLSLVVAENDLPGPLSIALKRTIGLVEAAQVGSVIKPKTLFSQLCARNPIFSEYGQQDAAELLLCITGGVQDEHDMRAKKSSSSSSSSSSLTTTTTTTTTTGGEDANCFSNFGGEVTVSIRCNQCQKVATKKEKILDLSLSIHGCKNVVDCLHSYFSPQRMGSAEGYACENCNREAFEIQKKMEAARERDREELTRRMLEQTEEVLKQKVEDEVVKVEAQDEEAEEEEEDEEDVHDEEEHEEDEEKEGEEEKGEKKLDDNNNINNSKKKEEQQQQQQPPKKEKEENKPPPKVEKVREESQPKQQEKQEEEEQAKPSTSATSEASKETKVESSATFASTLASLKNVVVVQLKRFSLNWQKGRWEKDTSKISFHSHLDFAPFFNASSTTKKEEEKKEILAVEVEEEEENKQVEEEEKKENNNNNNDSSSPSSSSDEALATLMKVYPHQSVKKLSAILDASGGCAEVALSLLGDGIDFGNLGGDEKEQEQKGGGGSGGGGGGWNKGGGGGGKNNRKNKNKHNSNNKNSSSPSTTFYSPESSSSASQATAASSSSSSTATATAPQEEDTSTSTITNNSSSSSAMSYRLVGVVEHSGTVDGGHYVSYFRSLQTEKWYHASDSWVRECEGEHEALSAQAYLLFYEKL